MDFGFISAVVGSLASAASGGLSRISDSLRGPSSPPASAAVSYSAAVTPPYAPAALSASASARPGLATAMRVPQPRSSAFRCPSTLRPKRPFVAPVIVHELSDDVSSDPAPAASPVSPSVGSESPAPYVAEPAKAPSFSDPRLTSWGRKELRRLLLSALPELHAYDLNTLDRVVDCLDLLHFVAGDRIPLDTPAFFLVAEGCVLDISSSETPCIRSSDRRLLAGDFRDSVPSSAVHYAETDVSLFSAPMARLTSCVTADLFAGRHRHAALKKLSLSDFVVVRMLGKGGFGAVALVQHTPSGCCYVLKKIHKEGGSYDPWKEANMVQGISNAPLVPFAADSSPDSLVHRSRAFFGRQASARLLGHDCFFLQEPLLGGSYLSLLHQIGLPRGENNDLLVLSESDARFYIACLILGVHHIHSTRHVHGDIKVANLMLDFLGYLTIIDYSLLKKVDSQGTVRGSGGTLSWSAPEKVTHGQHTFTADYWSIGAVLLRMVACRRLFPVREGDHEALRAHLSDPTPVLLPPDLSPEPHDLLSGLLEKDPAMRLGARHGLQEVRDHACFDGFDWRALERRKMTPPFVPLLSSPHDYHNLGQLDDSLDIMQLPTS